MAGIGPFTLPKIINQKFQGYITIIIKLTGILHNFRHTFNECCLQKLKMLLRYCHLSPALGVYSWLPLLSFLEP